MAANVFSRLSSSSHGGKSFYEELRGGTSDNDGDGIQGPRSYDVDEDNWAQQFQEQDLDDINTDRLAVEDSHITAGSTINPVRGSRGARRTHKASGPSDVSNWLGPDEEGDNDVPESLLVEHHETKAPMHTTSTGRPPHAPTQRGLLSRTSQTHWERVQAQQPLYTPPPRSHQRGSRGNTGGITVNNPREKALWRWINVSNLDFFMKDVYEYYLGSGFWCIVCERCLHLVQSAFIAVFLTFLTQCVDYSSVPHSKALSEVVVKQCTRHMAWYWNFFLWLFVFYFIWKVVQFVFDTRRLLNMRQFYVHLLEIPEQDMQTVSWQDIVARIMSLREANPTTAQNITPSQRRWLRAHSKERLDAVDIASRLMRKDNFLIALINKDVLDLSLPVPLIRSQQFLSATLQWWLYFGIIDFVFDHSGQVNQDFLKSSRRGLLSRKLRERLIVAGVLNLLCTPFWVGYQLLIHLLNYYNEYKKNSATLGDRRYTILARWKFREFNELPHFFHERINMSYPFASRYMDQFPKRLVEQVARTVTFISGAVTFVLAVASFVDPELFLGFEITKERTALFYIGVFGSIWALARGMISEETMVFDPEFALKGVTDFTHYIPDHWQGRLHSFDVKREFSELYKLKIVILIEEIIGIFFTSIVLIYSLPRSSEQIVDFFREFTIHVDGLGYVCSFAEFDFKKGVGNSNQHVDMGDVRGEYYTTKHGKMAASYYGFLENYVNNPKTGMPGGHVPPSMRRWFPPPAFPGLSSPTLAADIPDFRSGRGEIGRSHESHAQGPKTPRLGPSMTAPSPMASTLLDPHHQPSAAATAARNVHSHRGRSQRLNRYGDRNKIEEMAENGIDARMHSGMQEDVGEDVYESGGVLGESVWQTSPTKTISRETSEAVGSGQDTGVLGLIYQFQQAHRDNRMGGA